MNITMEKSNKVRMFLDATIKNEHDFALNEQCVDNIMYKYKLIIIDGL